MTGRVDPFVGLAPYGEQDAEWFFGREREVELIVANLRAARLTLLYGSSGVGKSSVLLAGALPRLRLIQDADRKDAVALAAHGGAALADRPSLAVALVRNWAYAPLVRVASAVHDAVVVATGKEELEPWDGVEPFGDWLREHAREVRTLLVILDQFEEYFMYHPDEDGPGTLAGELPGLLDDIDLRVNFLLGMREDALFRLDRFKGRIPDLFGNYLRLDYLEREAARTAIREPVRHYNETVRAGLPPVTVDDAVVEEVLDGVRAGRLALHRSDPSPGAAAGTRVETPYLQLVMRELWAAGTADGGHEVTPETLKSLGGAAVIVSTHLEQAMEELCDDDKAVAADVFRYLVTPSRTKIAHAAEDLAGFSGRPLRDVARVLQDLADSDRRVLRAVPGTSKGDPLRYELYHDVLAEAVHEWASRNRASRRALVERRERRRRWRKRALVVLACLACAGLAITFVPRLGGDEPLRAASARQLAESANRWLEKDPERAVLLAREAYRRAPDLPVAEDALRATVSESHLRAAYRRGEPRPCGAACARMEPRGKPKPVAVSMYAGRSDRYYDPYLGYGAAQAESDRWMSVAPSGHTIAVVRKGRVALWAPQRQDEPVREIAGARDVEKVAFIGTRGRLLLVTKKDAVLVAGAGRVQTVAKHATLVAASAGGRYVATAHRGGDVRLRDLETGETTRLRPGRRVTSLAFNPSDARQLAAGVRDEEGAAVILIDRASAAGTRLDAGGRYVGDAEGRFNGTGRRILITARGARPKVLDVATGRRVRGATAQLASATGVRWLGPWVAGTAGNLVKLGGTTVLGGHEFPVRATAAGPGGNLIATGADDGSARVWDAYTGNQMLELRAGGTPVTAVAFSPSGRFLVTGDAKRAVRIWAVSTGRALPDRFDWDAEFARDGSVLGAGYGGIVSWSQSGEGRLRRHRRAGAMGFGHEVAPESGTVAFLVWRRRAQVVVRSIDGGKRQVFRADSFVLSDDGERVLLLGARPRLVDVTGHADTVRFGKFKRLRSSAVSRDHRKVLLAGRVFDVDDPRRPVELEGRAGHSGAFSPDARRVLTAGRDVRIWDTATGRRLAVLEDHVGGAISARWSPDGTMIVTGGEDRTVRIWDAATFRPLGVVEGFPDRVVDAKLDWDGRRLLTSTPFSSPRIVTCTPCLPTDELADMARRNVTRDLTAKEKTDVGLTP